MVNGKKGKEWLNISFYKVIRRTYVLRAGQEEIQESETKEIKPQLTWPASR